MDGITSATAAASAAANDDQPGSRLAAIDAALALADIASAAAACGIPDMGAEIAGAFGDFAAVACRDSADSLPSAAERLVATLERLLEPR